MEHRKSHQVLSVQNVNMNTKKFCSVLNQNGSVDLGCTVATGGSKTVIQNIVAVKKCSYYSLLPNQSAMTVWYMQPNVTLENNICIILLLL